MKKIIFISIGIIALTSLYFTFFNKEENEIKYRFDKVIRGDIILQIRATGTLNPKQTVEVGSQVSGTIAKLFADFNSKVRKGEIIAIIDSTFLYASLKEAEANMERVQAQVNEAKRNLNRISELYNKNLVSQSDYDAASTSYETSIAQLKQSESAYEKTKVNFRYSVIRSPIDGIVISRDVDIGQTVAASFQSPKLFSIANDLSIMQVEANVDEADIGQISENQIVAFTVDAFPNEEFEGKVTQVRLAPIIVQNVVTYVVVIDVKNKDLKLRPGMTATVSIIIDKKENVLKINQNVLKFQPPFIQNVEEEKNENKGARKKRNSFSQVWILDSQNKLKSIYIKTGKSDNRYVEIIEGNFKDGDSVIIGIEENGKNSTTQVNPFMPRTTGGGGRRGF